ncbi:vWA domain-containing protein [Aeromonas fluvialis]|uniref:vWA domain-containing protein n=1 Tax=Aeromonas fluvialis TaxID=591962 RepID=UPI0005A9B90F|nr:VWA domain-containing protein [Aeromonas fluvialis]
MELILLRPLWLIALIPWLWQGWRRHRQPPLLAPAMQAYLLPASRPQRHWRWLATLPVILALSGPALRGGLQAQPAAPLDIWLLDLSRSMNATDLKPDRATRVRWQLQQLLSRAKGERIALILYAGDAYLAMPPTRDHQALSLLLPDLRPDIMPLQGSNPARAVELAMKQLAPDEQARLLLITDDLTQSQMTQIAALWPCQQRLLCRDTQSARLDILLASSGQPAPMPAIPANELGFATRMPAQLPTPDSQAIAALANRLGGELQWLGSDVPRFAPLPTTTSALTPAPLDLGPWLLIPLLPLALLARVGARLMVVMMMGSQLLAPQDLQAVERGDLHAMQAYQQGDFQRAARTFNDPIWRGNAWYRAGAYRLAIAAYQETASATAHYNRGNALLQLGEFASAKEAYLAALALKPDHEDALYNLSLLQGGAGAVAAPDNSNSKQPEPTTDQHATAMPLPPSPPVLLLEQRLRKEALRRDMIKVEEPW